MSEAHTSLILVDDHKILRQGLRALLADDPTIDIIGEAGDGRSGVALAVSSCPDIAIVDVALPDLNGIETTRQILEHCPQCRVIALSMHSEKQFVTAILGAGARGYLLKNAAVDELHNAIHDVLDGKVFLSPALVEMAVEDFAKRHKNSNRVGVIASLTSREREILQLLAEGASAYDVADKLNVSISTVNTHRQQIMRKLNARNAVEMTRIALREGIAQL